MFKKTILWDSVYGTVFIFGLILLFQFVRFLGQSSIFDPIGDAIGDVEFTDLVFSQLREDPKVDTSIVLVNIGKLSRREIAREIEIINQYQPKVIGIDSYFWNLKKDSLGDEMLSKAFGHVKNLILASKLLYNPKTQQYDSIQYSNKLFLSDYTGFANVVTDATEQHQFKVNRMFAPKITIDGHTEYALSVEIASIYNPHVTQTFLDRNNDYETINYRGNIIDYGQTNYGGRFIALDIADVFQHNFTPEIIKDKIILLGYMGENFNEPSWEDKFYTPLNKKYAGRANPDMFGVVIHANIISMILNNDYINRQSQGSSTLWAIIITFTTVIGFTWIYKRLPEWYDGLTKTIQIIEVLLILTCNVFLFHWFSYKTDLTIATIAVALAGDSLEVCFGLLKNLFTRKGRRLIFKIHHDKS